MQLKSISIGSIRSIIPKIAHWGGSIEAFSGRLWSNPRTDQFFWALFILGGGALVLWPQELGVSVAVLATVAAVLTLRELKSFHKLLGVIVVSLLLVAEIRAIHNDHKEQEEKYLHDRKELQDDFEKVLSQNQKEFSETINKLKVVGDQVTGGDNYAYISVIIFNEENHVLIINAGNTTIYHTSIKISPVTVDSKLVSISDIRVIDIGDVLPGATILNDTIIPGRYEVQIWARNGVIREKLKLLPYNGHLIPWEEIYRGDVMLFRSPNLEDYPE